MQGLGPPQPQRREFRAASRMCARDPGRRLRPYTAGFSRKQAPKQVSLRFAQSSEARDDDDRDSIEHNSSKETLGLDAPAGECDRGTLYTYISLYVSSTLSPFAASPFPTRPPGTRHCFRFGLLAPCTPGRCVTLCCAVLHTEHQKCVPHKPT
eukprot:scaffold7777_cov111-Isochrysis_galbana.AAC.2